LTTIAVEHNELIEAGLGQNDVIRTYDETRAWLLPKRSRSEKSHYWSHMRFHIHSVADVFPELDHRRDWWAPKVAEYFGSRKIGLVARPKFEKDRVQGDLEWFASASNELDSFRGKYVAIHDKRIVGWGKTSVDAANMAKRTRDGEKAIIAYVPGSEASAL